MVARGCALKRFSDVIVNFLQKSFSVCDSDQTLSDWSFAPKSVDTPAVVLSYKNGVSECAMTGALGLGKSAVRVDARGH
jgi:hypothetical protein